MHLVGFGILIWIGLAITPALISTALWLLPGAFGAAAGALALGLLTQSLGGVWLGALIGGVGLHWLIWKKQFGILMTGSAMGLV